MSYDMTLPKLPQHYRYSSFNLKKIFLVKLVEEIIFSKPEAEQLKSFGEKIIFNDSQI